MYLTSIPINCNKFHRIKNKQLILDELKAFGTDRVMLNYENALDGHIILHNEEDYQRQLDYMRKACSFFKENGYEVGAWFWGFQFDSSFDFVRIKTINGNNAGNFACPTDNNFLEVFQKCLRDVVKTGVDIILLNDDVRFGQWGGFGCLCENHIKMICDELGERIEESQLKELILNGGKNKYRDAFLKVNKISMENYAVKMRNAVDEINPEVRLGFCACMSSWDIDGDAFRLAKLLAGKTKPILRLIGAPYWAVDKSWGNNLQDVVELERMEAAWNTDCDIELIAEGDAYPRPRLNCPAAFLEGFDTALRASGEIDGILKICVDYVSNVGYESGYLKQYIKNKPVYQAIEKHFSDKKHTGIRIYESMKKVAEMPLPNALGEKSDIENVFFSSAARVLSANAIPTVYKGAGVTGIAFGENAYTLTDDDLDNGIILDALAAKILSDKGIDVGIDVFGEGLPMKFQYFCDDENYVIANICAYKIELNSNCKILSYVSNDLEKPQLPFCFLYKNKAGQKFLIFNCNAKNSENLLKHQANAKIIADSTEWLSGKKLPAFCYGHPNLYMQCKEDDKYLVIGLWNFFEDQAIEPIIQLSETYQNAQFLCGAGKLCGDIVHLEDIHPFGFSGIVLEKTISK